MVIHEVDLEDQVGSIRVAGKHPVRRGPDHDATGVHGVVDRQDLGTVGSHQSHPAERPTAQQPLALGPVQSVESRHVSSVGSQYRTSAGPLVPHSRAPRPYWAEGSATTLVV